MLAILYIHPAAEPRGPSGDQGSPAAVAGHVQRTRRSLLCPKETLRGLIKAPGRCRPSPLRENIHQPHLPLSIPGNPPGHSGWRQRLCYPESLQAHGHLYTGNFHCCSSWTQKCLSALDEAKAQIAISHDSPGIDLALRRQQGSKVESVSLRGP